MSTLENSVTTGAVASLQRDQLTLSVVIPCLNEEENITEVVALAREVLEREGI